MILPLRVFGRPAVKAISFGASAGPSRFRAKRGVRVARRRLAQLTCLSTTKALIDLADQWVGLADDPSFGDGRGVPSMRSSTQTVPPCAPTS